ncbi:hypothetical protein KJ660_01120 [Candidatus Micrarchaeota archaeon]|nr:hypothetical protein [Candidatus Micrarchaeota archaeon]
MMANIKFGGIIFGVLMIILGFAWLFDSFGYFYPFNYPWAQLIVVWIGLGALGFSFSKKFCP